jgi:DNA (cytosine-5)-methyltransferase 1
MSGAYYNENDPHAAAWLRELIRRGLIADGVVDTRSIEDVRPIDLRGFVQCHFFAGIGGWSRALRLAGWPDHERVWTGSCPCQPFSDAGAGAGFADKRHLWPAWLHLIAQCGPAVVFGEQVASATAMLWWDLVSADFEGQGYACAAADLAAAGVGAPHIRQRLFWVADTGRARLERRDTGALGHELAASERGGRVGRMANADGQRRAQGEESHRGSIESEQQASRRSDAPRCGDARGLAYAELQSGRAEHEREPRRREEGPADTTEHNGVGAQHDPGALHGFWRAADWLGCRDGKWRPVEPGTFPLAHGLPARVGRLRGYGNAIVPQVAAEFVVAYLETRSEAALFRQQVSA